MTNYTTRLRFLNDVNFGLLNPTKNNNVVKYDHSSKKFILVSTDSVLSGISTIPQTFSNVVRDELDSNRIKFDGLDAGEF